MEASFSNLGLWTSTWEKSCSYFSLGSGLCPSFASQANCLRQPIMLWLSEELTLHNSLVVHTALLILLKGAVHHGNTLAVEELHCLLNEFLEWGSLIEVPKVKLWLGSYICIPIVLQRTFSTVIPALLLALLPLKNFGFVSKEGLLAKETNITIEESFHSNQRELQKILFAEMFPRSIMVIECW